MKLLNLGCGGRYHKDWINIDFKSNNEDVIEHNLLKGIPLNNQNVDVVYHSHVLEHFSQKEGKLFMKECYRVLKPNGILRVAVPDLEAIAKEYLKNLNFALSGDEDGKNNYDWIKLELFDQMVRNTSGGEMAEYLAKTDLSNEKYIYSRIGLEGKSIRKEFLSNGFNKKPQIVMPRRKMNFQICILKSKKIITSIKKKLSKKNISNEEIKALRIGKFRLGGEIHQWMYDRYSLFELLKETGFDDISICTPFESEICNWEAFQLDVIDGEVRKPDSLFMEARKK